MQYQVRFKSFFTKTFTLIVVTSIALVLLFSIVVGMSLKSTYEDQQIKSHLKNLENTSSFVNAATKTIVETTNMLTVDADIINASVVPSVMLHKRNYSIIERLKRVEQADNFINTVYLYIVTGDLVFSTSQSIVKAGESKDLLIIRNFTDSVNLNKQFVLIEDGSSSGSKKLFYSMDFVGAGDFRLGQIIAGIDTKSLYENIRQQWQGIVTDIRIVDSNGNVVVGDKNIGEAYTKIATMEAIKNRPSGYIHVSDRNGPYELLFHSLDVKGWKLVCKIDSPRFFMFEPSFLSLFIPALALYLAFAAALAYMISRNLYKPIEGLVKLILKDRGGELRTAQSGKNNEFELIGTEYSSVVDNKNDAVQLVKDSIPYVTENLFDRLMHGKSLSDQDRKLFSRFLNIEVMDTCLFVALSVRILDENPPSDDELSFEKQFSLLALKDGLNAILSGMKQELFISSEEEKITILLCVTPEAGDGKRLREELIAFFDRMSQDQPSLSVFAGIGQLYTGLSSVGNTHREAEETLRYMVYMGKKGAMTFDDVSGREENSNETNSLFYQESSEIKKIINSISSGDAGSMEQHLSEIFKSAGGIRSFDEKYTSHLFLQILDAMVQYSIKSNIYIPETDPGAIKSLYRNLEGMTGIEEMTAYIKDIGGKIVAEVNRGKNLRYHKYVAKTKEFIEEHYSDHSISLNSIADHVGVNSTYLSKLFKDETNENITEFVNKLRIEKAKELLDLTGISVKEVGYCVGFSSIQNFIKTFKRYEGVTPGQYGKRL